LDPALDASVAAEARGVCGGSAVRHEHLPHLSTLQRVVAETFRIRPAAWMFSRVTVDETVLADCRIPAGSDILLSPYVLHHRADLFPDPERFDPSRWNDSARSLAKAEHTLTMIPFGAGSRKCIGREFSINNITLALAAILAAWKFTLANTTRVRLSGRSIIEPRGLTLRLQRRPAEREPAEQEETQ
jgi:pentalenene oxygenase